MASLLPYNSPLRVAQLGDDILVTSRDASLLVRKHCAHLACVDSAAVSIAQFIANEDQVGFADILLNAISNSIVY